MRKFTGLLLAATAVAGLVSCGASVEQVRKDAAERLDGMVFIDDEGKDQVRSKLEAAKSVDEVTSVIEAAAVEDQAAADKYWPCAEQAVAKLTSGVTWTAASSTTDGSKLVWAALALRPDGVASMEVTDKGANVAHEPLKGAVWIEKLAGKVTGWSSDATELLAKRRVIGEKKPRFDGPGSCEFQFNLTLTTSAATDPVRVRMEYYKTSYQPGLIIDGAAFRDLESGR